MWIPYILTLLVVLAYLPHSMWIKYLLQQYIY